MLVFVLTEHRCIGWKESCEGDDSDGAIATQVSFCVTSVLLGIVLDQKTTIIGQTINYINKSTNCISI